MPSLLLFTLYKYQALIPASTNLPGQYFLFASSASRVLPTCHKAYLALVTLRVHPSLLLHLGGNAHQVVLHHGVLDLAQALLADVGLLDLAAVGHNACVNSLPGPTADWN